MPFNFLPIALGGASALGGFLASEAADDAANDAARILQGAEGEATPILQNALRRGTEARVAGFDTARGDISTATGEAVDENQAALERSLDFINPELVAARGAQNLLNDALGVNGPEAQAAFFQNFEDDPGFQAELQDRINAIDRSATAKGQLLSGRTLKAVGDEGQRFRRGAFTDRLNRLRQQASGAGGLATTGAGLIETTGGRVSNALLSRGTNLANLATRRGEAQASGIEGVGQVGATSALNRGDIAAENRLTRGRNRVRLINTLSGAAGTALSGLPNDLGRGGGGGAPGVPSAASFPGRRFPGERLRGRV